MAHIKYLLKSRVLAGLYKGIYLVFYNIKEGMSTKNYLKIFHILYGLGLRVTSFSENAYVLNQGFLTLPF